MTNELGQIYARTDKYLQILASSSHNSPDFWDSEEISLTQIPLHILQIFIFES